MPLAGRWTPLPPLPSALVRSSHALAVVGHTAWIFGGELEPRTPLDANLIAVSLKDGHSRTLPPSSSTPWPAPRVGASLIALGTSLYLWGGRGGKSMAPFSPEEDLWRFDTEKEAWAQLKTEGARPEQRSFHAMATSGNTLYLHAGCPSSGRLETIHSLDLAHSPPTWTTRASAPGPARGGTVLASLPSSPLLARFGGFAGYELGGLDVFDTEKEQWSTVDADVDGGGPGKRSVHMLIGLDGSLEWAGEKVVAVMALGEREGAPAELGHDGAGFFHADAWGLLSSDSSPPKYSWIHLPPSSDSQGTPEARGWFGADRVGGNEVVLQGGLNANNERLGDGWTLEVIVES